MDDLRTCDVLVVGAGPAGSVAARTAARRGVSVLLAERRRRVGVPVRCAEFVPLPVSKHLDLSNRDITVQPVRAMRTFLPGADPKENLFPGVIIRRERFDQELARLAVEAGVVLVTGLQVYRSTPEGIRAWDGHREVAIRSRVIVGADGPCSQVARWMGQTPGPFLVAAQVSLKLSRPLDHTRIYFHPEISGGYGWVFPKGDRANLGVGLDAGQSRNLRITLDGFKRERMEEGLVEAAEKPAGGGLVPVGGLKGLWLENLILAGDAAGTCHPISGAGVGNALISGELAGEAAAAAVLQGTSGPLAGYRDELHDLLGPSLARAAAKRKKMIRHWKRMDFAELIKENWIAFKEYYRS